jgi:hypothetical protein
VDRLLKFFNSKQRLAYSFTLVGREFVGVEVVGIFLNPFDNPDLKEDAVPRKDLVSLDEAGGRSG